MDLSFGPRPSPLEEVRASSLYLEFIIIILKISASKQIYLCDIQIYHYLCIMKLKHTFNNDFSVAL